LGGNVGSRASGSPGNYSDNFISWSLNCCRGEIL
jgi:hypothetical protein